MLWYTAEQGDFENHFLFGFILLTLLTTRLIWGFIGSETSRFSQFIKSPKILFKPPQPITIGHNPQAGYMVLILLSLLFLQIFSGLFASDDVFTEGPLYSFVSESFAEKMDNLHHSNFDLLLIFIGLHVIAALYHQLKGDGLIQGIFTGKNTLPKLQQQPQLFWRSSLIALTIWLVLFLLLYFTIDIT